MIATGGFRSPWTSLAIALAALVLVILDAWPAAASGTIRVAVLPDAPRVELRGTEIEVTEAAGCERCGRPWRVSVVRAVASAEGIEIDGRRAVRFRLTSDRPIRLNGREYAGALELVRVGDVMAVVNELPLEEYLVGVLRAETGDRWPAEALRAQAIVARTYAAYQRVLNAAKPYHILASTAHQQFAGRVPPSSPAWEAVRDTTGVVLRWEGELFPAFYHTESGGYTEDPRTVFAARNMPALKPIRCEFSTGSPHYQWTLDVRLAELSETLRRNNVNVGTVVGIEVSERTPLAAAETFPSAVRGLLAMKHMIRSYLLDADDPYLAERSEEVRRVFRSRVANPKWIASMKRHGYKGAFEIAAK